MQKQNHNWNWSGKYFILRVRISKEWCKNAWNYTNFLMMWHELFPTHKHGCQKGAGIWKYQQKRLFSQFRYQTLLLLPPQRNIWKNPLVPPLEKILPTAMHTSMQNYTTIVKHCVVLLHHLAILFKNTLRQASHSRVTDCTRCILPNNYEILPNLLPN